MIITLQSCTTEQPEPPSQPPEPIEFTGYDMTDNAGKALQNLEVFLNSVTRTSTTIPKHIQNSSNFTTETTNLIDHSDIWDDLAQCESGGNWSYPPVSGGFSGGIMFHIATWQAMGGLNYAPDAYLATREQQIKVATQVLDASGWGAWPGCARKLGLR